MHDNVKDHELQEEVAGDLDGAAKAQKWSRKPRPEAGPPTTAGKPGLSPSLRASWSIFQLLLAEAFIIQADITRAIHLAFAIVLVYLSYPLFKKRTLPKAWLWLSDKNRFHLVDFVLAALAACSALYIAVFYQDLADRSGIYITQDLVAGAFLVVLLLEAARRALGPALTCVATVFILYSFFGPYMPDLIAFKGVSLNRFMGQIAMSTEGIYGVPLDVSAKIVFLFVLFGATLERAGGGRWFVDLAYSLLGGMRGGPAKAAVMASGLSGMVSGSSIANVVTTGTFTIPLMKDVGYPDTKGRRSGGGRLHQRAIDAPPSWARLPLSSPNTAMSATVEVIRARIHSGRSVLFRADVYITHIEAGKARPEGHDQGQSCRIVRQNLYVRDCIFVIPLAGSDRGNW